MGSADAGGSGERASGEHAAAIAAVAGAGPPALLGAGTPSGGWGAATPANPSAVATFAAPASANVSATRE